jgi:ATP-binding cassette subfamily F protein 3
VFSADSEPKVKSSGLSEGSGRKTKEQKRQEAEERQRRAQERRDLETALAKAESKVATMEARRGEIGRLLDDSGLYQRDPGAVVSLNRELAQLGDELERATVAWEELAGKMEVIAGA